MEAGLAALNLSDGEEEPLLVQDTTDALEEDFSLCLTEDRKKLGRSSKEVTASGLKGSTLMDLGSDGEQDPISMADGKKRQRGLRHRPFRFEANWLLEQDCEECIAKFWSSNTEPLPKKLESLGKELQYWGTLRRKRCRELKSALESRLRVLEDGEPDEDSLAELIEGNVVSSLDGILNTASAYFSELFTATTVCDTDVIFANVRRSITNELNSALIAPFKSDEIFAALRTMSPLKAPDRIGCIPLARSKPCDELIWRCENTGLYSRKSGYRVLLEMSLQQHSINHDPSVTLQSSFYQSLWALNLPTKCKIVIWRLMHNFLPTFTNLQQRKLHVRNTCRFCESAADTPAHFVFFCPATLCILSSVGLSPTPTMQHSGFDESFATWFLHVNTRQHQLIVITYWSLWYARNELVHNGSTFSTVKVSSFILAFLLSHESSTVVTAPRQGIKNVKWFPPDGDIIKFNFDASFNAESKSSISGIVARDCQGFIVAACTCPHSGIGDAFIAEAVACDKAVSFALELGFRSVQIEGDSLSLIKKLSSAMADKSVISPILLDIKALSKAFDIITFSFVSREGNKVAHELARARLQYSEPRYWIEEAPTTVERLAQRDRPP
ncbi:hypothetical protein V6N12_034967 [Hibiscus sabdariffa]|uniref:RNase H type-1 domain-containing protein n=1 Tax=Hibiscus sabdariffa TaxID=183260 RepID=A0ABR2BP61_9ROSI